MTNPIPPSTDEGITIVNTGGWYTPDATGVDIGACGNTLTNALFALVYTDLGIPADFNLIKAAMGEPNTGFRRLLDMVSVSVTGDSCTLYDTGTLLWDEHMGDEIPAFNAGPEAARAIVMGVTAGRQYFTLLYSALADGVLDSAEQNAINGWLAPDLLFKLGMHRTVNLF